MIDAQQAQLDAQLSGLDLLIADSSYTDDEYRTGKIGWGHGTYGSHIAWARRIGARSLVCTHHEPTRSDDELERVFQAALDAAGHQAGAAGEPSVELSREGLEITL
jgi:ribonuclease BN (tRNA processing enzyme)